MQLNNKKKYKNMLLAMPPAVSSNVRSGTFSSFSPVLLRRSINLGIASGTEDLRLGLCSL